MTEAALDIGEQFVVEVALDPVALEALPDREVATTVQRHHVERALDGAGQRTGGRTDAADALAYIVGDRDLVVGAAQQ
ncbi:MAG TPA: hypothetical protein DGT21_14295 [Armatimonadetes bacterium]|nr:hypothetical protein [Armatimonadota bacterium]